MKISACMIVKNEEKMLEKTLPTLAKGADEIILVDTGSTDKTVEVAKKYGAKIYSFPWINDFSAARNESLKHAAGDWIIWIDADEYLTAENLNKLRQEIEIASEPALEINLYENKLGDCAKQRGYPRVKAFKNGLGYHFIRPINEQLVDARENAVKGKATGVDIFHWGQHLEALKMQEKRERYVKLYSEALRTKPDDPYLHFLLANKLNDLKRLAEALPHYSRASELAGGKEVGRQALEKKADVLLRLQNFKEAAGTAEALLKLDPNNIPARNVYASILLITGQTDLAIKLLIEALEIKTEAKIESQYQTRVMPNFLLGKAYEIKGEKEKAAVCYAKVREISPEMVKGK